jgi:hypothetical protein
VAVGILLCVYVEMLLEGGEGLYGPEEEKE